MCAYGHGGYVQLYPNGVQQIGVKVVGKRRGRGGGGGGKRGEIKGLSLDAARRMRVYLLTHNRPGCVIYNVSLTVPGEHDAELWERMIKRLRNDAIRAGVSYVYRIELHMWQIYKIRFEQPIGYDLICDFDFSTLDGQSEEHQEKLFIICKEGINKNARAEFHEKMQCLNRFILGALILSEDGPFLTVIRRELRKLHDGFLVTPEDIIRVLKNEVLKRDAIEGDEAQKAQSRVKKFYRKAAKETGEESAAETSVPPSQPQDVPFSDQLLKESKKQEPKTE